MGGFMKIIFLIFVSGLFLGCSHQNQIKAEKSQKQHEFFQSQLSQALSLAEAEQDAAAFRILKKLISKAPSFQMASVVYFNIGSLFEKKRQCAPAKKLYKKSLLANEKQETLLEAQTLWRLGFVYECLKDYDGMLASLKDVQSRVHFLPPEVAFVELNARLALAYSYLKVPDLSKSYWV